MDIEQLRYFLAVCDCKQMTLAADTLFRFSPRITQRFTRIETILGFVRENAGLSLLMAKDLTAFDCHGICQKKITPSIPSTVALVFPHGRQLSPAARALRDFLLSPLAKKKTI